MSDWLPARLPEDIEAERSLLATCSGPGMEERARRISRGLSEADFVAPQHKALFTALHSLLEDALEVNALTLKDRLEQRGQLGSVGGFTGLTELLAAEEVGRPEILADLLKRKRQGRELVKLGARLIREAVEGASEMSAIVIEGMEELGRIGRQGQAADVTSWAEALEMASNLEAFRDGHGARGGSWGIAELDEIAPIPAGQVTFVAARPGVGKTALLTQIAVQSAILGWKPFIVQLELPKKTALARITSYLARTSTRVLKEGSYGPQVAQTLRNFAEELQDGRLISPRQGTPWHRIESTLIESIERDGTNLVLIDYFSLLGRPATAKGSNEAYAFARVSEQITAFAKEHQGVGVVLLGQLKQDAADREPKDGDVADSDRPARDAAVSLFLWRDAHEQIRAVLRKNRDGGLGWKRTLAFEGWSQRFSVMEQETAEPPRRRG